MSDSTDNSVSCSNCGYIFHGDDLYQESGKRKPCPNCGSLRRNIHVSVKETLVLHEYVGLKVKKPFSKHKKNRADYESYKGVRKGKNGKLVFVRKIKDREHPNSPGSYIEYVRDKDGNIIENKSEKLSEHKSSSKNK